MSANPAISIVVPVYNVQPYLRECLDSVAAQTFTDWECICVDDGASDGSGAILDEYARRDGRFIVRHLPNQGAAYARNRGMELMRGDYVMFVDSDDILDASILQELHSQLKQHSADMATCWWKYSDGRPDALQLSDAVSANPLKDWLSGKVVVYNVPWAKLIARPVVDGLSFPEDLQCMNDVWFVANLMLRVKKVVCLSERLYTYRILEGSLAHPATPERHRTKIDCAFRNALLFQQSGVQHGLTPKEMVAFHRAGGFLTLFQMLSQAINGHPCQENTEYIISRIRELRERGVVRLGQLPRTLKALYFLCVICRSPSLYKMFLRAR